MDSETKTTIDCSDVSHWRQEIHAHPETAFEEFKTSGLVAEKLRSFGIAVETGLAETGVVGVLDFGPGPCIGLRADMDALHIEENTGLQYASTCKGKMHACGHDGHTAMLLGAARHLAQRTDLKGKIIFVFQPAEENEGGGKRMIDEGLFAKYDVDQIYGLHNWPGLQAGAIAVHSGPVMAAFDLFEIEISGKSAHAAMPHDGSDIILAGSRLVEALNTITSRDIDPLKSCVVSVTQFHGGSTWNILPGRVTLNGCVRHFDPTVQAKITDRMNAICDGFTASFGVEIKLNYMPRYPATINSLAEADTARSAAENTLGASRVDTGLLPSMASEDFGYMLQERPGTYVWLGNGSAENRQNLHSDRYDFNDEIIPVGVEYWVRLCERVLDQSA